MRRATRSDLGTIEALTKEVFAAELSGVLPPEEARAAAGAAFRDVSLREKIIAGDLVIGVDRSGVPAVAAIIDRHEDHVAIRTLVVRPRSTVVHTAAKLTAYLRRSTALPLSADVVLGDVDHERFHEAAGFVPGEVVEDDVAGRAVIRRRWWLAAS